jgi:hypothetical protein
MIDNQLSTAYSLCLYPFRVLASDSGAVSFGHIYRELMMTLSDQLAIRANLEQ